MSDKSTKSTAGSTGLSKSDRHSLLASDRRRLALDVLGGKATPVGLEELAKGVAAREEGIDAVDDETVERVAITLHHVHLPKLRESGVLDYDPESHRIAADQISYSAGNGPTNLMAKSP